MFTKPRTLISLLRRHIAVQTSTTPNPACFKFTPVGKPVTGSNDLTLQVEKGVSEGVSPLADRLLQLPSVERVFFGSDFISVTAGEDWTRLKPAVVERISQHYDAEESLFA